METITQQQVKEAINAFLNKQLERELDFEVSKLKSVTQEKIDSKRGRLAESYNYKSWSKNFFGSLEFMMDQELSLATHTSKGVNSLVKSDNILFSKKKASAHDFICHNTLKGFSMDANSNNTGGHAGHLKHIVDFLNIDCSDKKVHQVFLFSKEAFTAVFFESTGDYKKANTFYDYLSQNLLSKPINPTTDVRNKQTLIPLNGCHKSYQLLIPLHPSSFTYSIFECINEIKFSESLKLARKLNFKGQNLKPYQTFIKLAVMKLGGDNAQNVGRLNNKQNGRSYLLPSLPPKFTQTKQFKVSPYANSIFDKALDYRCQETFKALVRLVETQYNNVNIRKARQAILDDLLFQVVSVASSVQQQEKPGWSREFSLNYSEKLWLDPQRGAIEGQETFQQDRLSEDWRADISKRFASWVNAKLRESIKNIKHDFADSEHIEWQREMDEMIGQSQRSGQGVFL